MIRQKSDVRHLLLVGILVISCSPLLLYSQKTINQPTQPVYTIDTVTYPIIFAPSTDQSDVIHNEHGATDYYYERYDEETIFDTPAFESIDLSFGRRYRTQIHYEGYEIYGAEMNIITDHNGRVLYHHNTTPDFLFIDRQLPKEESIDGLKQRLSLSQVLFHRIVWIMDNGSKLRLGRLYEVMPSSNSYVYWVILHGEEELYRQRAGKHHRGHHKSKTNKSFKKKNSTFEVKVNYFNPDPLTSSQTTYGENIEDDKDANSSLLTAELVEGVIHIDEERVRNDTLQNDFVRIVDFEDPTVPVVSINPADPQAKLMRGDAGFEQLHVLYHVEQFRNHLTSLGMPNVASTMLEVDAEAYAGEDASSFHPAPSFFSPAYSVLRIGVGGVDDAEDADIIIHEYIHHLVHDVTRYTSSIGGERNTLEEGLCDYFSVSYSRAISEYGWEDVFNWDGHNVFWEGRKATTDKCYDTTQFSDIYQHTDLVASVLMDAYEELGRSETDKMVLRSIPTILNNVSLRDYFGQMVLQENTLRNLDNANALKTILLKYCLRSTNVTVIQPVSPVIDIQFKNSLAFARSEAPLEIDFIVESPFDIVLYIYDIGGRLMRKEMIDEKQWTLAPKELARGSVYVFVIEALYRGRSTREVYRVPVY